MNKNVEFKRNQTHKLGKMKKRDQCPRLVLKTQMDLKWSLLAASEYRRSCSSEEELKKAECHQMKTNPSLIQVLGDSQKRREMFRGRKHAPRVASKMVAI
jgi:hypothetical protein